MSDAIERARRCASTQDWLLTAAQSVACGLSLAEVRAEVRAGRWLALLRGVYLLDPDLYGGLLPPRTWWRAALLAHGPTTCLVAGSAARAFGVEGLPAQDPVVEVATVGGVPRAARRAAARPLVDGPSVEVRQLPVLPEEVVVLDGLPVRGARFTVVDAALDLDRFAALAVLDSALHLQLLSSVELEASLEAAQGRPGIRQLREVGSYADARAESPVESRLRLCCIDERVPPDELQHVVRDPHGYVLAIGDLGWLRRRPRPLLAEADGVEVHGRLEALYRDRRRGNALTGAACDTLRFTFSDTLRPRYVGSVVRAALAAA